MKRPFSHDDMARFTGRSADTVSTKGGYPIILISPLQALVASSGPVTLTEDGGEKSRIWQITCPKTIFETYPAGRDSWKVKPFALFTGTNCWQSVPAILASMPDKEKTFGF